MFENIVMETLHTLREMALSGETDKRKVMISAFCIFKKSLSFGDFHNSYNMKTNPVAIIYFEPFHSQDHISCFPYGVPYSSYNVHVSVENLVLD